MKENSYLKCTTFKISKSEINLLPNKTTSFTVSFIPTKVNINIII